jgi:hypothetical protein
MGRRPRDALAFGPQGRALLRRRLAGRRSQGADGGEALPELVVKLASQAPAFVVLQGDQLARQLVALASVLSKLSAR